ncbi:chemotaxis protein CheW [Variovorax sp. LjRoot290]|uniref:chemotaxis protein CheW n=1 Tax=unclassified Variovorax TaxID=663243 RepID=UPI003ECEB634
MQKTSVVKGVRFDAAVAPLVSRMELVNDHRESLQRLADIWDQLALLGQMSDSGTDIASTGARFHELTGVLLDSLARRLLQDALRTARAKAQTGIDILVRNLYERTADIGFLATDSALRDAIAGGAQVRQRLRAYATKYSVYDDVILLGTDGAVLARLDESVAATAADGELMQAVLHSGAPFVESFGRFELLGGRRGLLYGAPVRESDAGAVIGALCLSFRFDDEMRAIFAALASRDDASVVLLLDAGRTVIASSDPQQVPVGAVLPRANALGHGLRFGGRDYLAAQTPAAGYQGYRGPGWDGCVLVPVDLAFRADIAGSTSDAALSSRVVAASRLFGEELQAIPAHAKSIQRGLERLVWNGQVRIRHEQDGHAPNAHFAGALLERVTRTGQRISAVFEHAIGDLQQSAVASVLEEVRACSALGIDIMDRSFYERANDCRWWALDSNLQRAARERDARACSEATAVLGRINGLYTVYSQLLLLDPQGHVLAASNGTPATAPLVAAWLPAALALRDEQAFVRSSFAASPLYGDRHTYVFAAPVQGAGGNAGCVAIVFDSEPQMQAMLRDALPVDAEGRPMPQALGLFVARGGAVVASTGGAWKTGTTAPFADRLAQLARGASSGTVLEIDGMLYAAGITMSCGYREYESGGTCGPDDVACVILIALCERAAQDGAAALEPFDPPAGSLPGTDRVAIASALVGDQWLGLPASQVIEAVVVPQVASVSGVAAGTTGIAMHDGQALAVVDLQRRRGQPSTASGADRLLVVCKTASGQRFALRVDEVGTVFDAQRSALQDLPAALAAHDPLATAVVRGGNPSDQRMLTVISVDKLISK